MLSILITTIFLSSISCHILSRTDKSIIVFKRALQEEPPNSPHFYCLNRLSCPLDGAVRCKIDVDAEDWDCTAKLPGGLVFNETFVECVYFERDGKEYFNHETCILKYSVQEGVDDNATGYLLTILWGIYMAAALKYHFRRSEEDPVPDDDSEESDDDDEERSSSPVRKLPNLDTKTEREDKACVICLENARVCVVVPCGHRLYCITCSNKFNAPNCLVCNKSVEKVIRVFK
jgi:hypothetical protein